MSAAAHRRFAAVVFAGAVALAGCGGGGEAEPAPATRGANVDPAADGVIGGSVNKAKGVAGDAEERDNQLEPQGDG